MTMRLGLEDLITPQPLLDTMPLVYLTDPLADLMCAAFDEVLAPVYATLDCFPAYLDPRTTPEDMLDWLAGWIGLTLNTAEQTARKRELIVTGAALLPWRGTPRSVQEAVVAAFNLRTEVVESGAVDYSTEAGADLGVQPTPSLTVRVFADSADDVDRRSLDELVDAVKPAHIPHRVEVVVNGAPAQDPPGSPG